MLLKIKDRDQKSRKSLSYQYFKDVMNITKITFCYIHPIKILFLVDPITMNIYFVSIGHKREIEVIKECKPTHILISYFYFNKKEKIERFIERIGYKPKLILDSGAYSAFNSGKDISVTAYIKFVKECEEYFQHYIQLDVFQNEFITKTYYNIMKHEGLHPLPVFHYGFNEDLLQYFIEQGETYIALGGTVSIANKRKVAEWVKLYCWLYPDIKFHLLGSFSLKILDTCDLASVDASTWVMAAIKGKPYHIPSRKARMIYNMQKLMEYERGIANDIQMLGLSENIRQDF